MKEQIFNANKLLWKETTHGKTKLLVGEDYSTSSRFRLFMLEPGEAFTSHEHDFTQCMYFTSGKGIVSIDDREEQIEPGLTVIVLPKQCHAIHNMSDERMEIVVFESIETQPQDTPFVDF